MMKSTHGRIYGGLALLLLGVILIACSQGAIHFSYSQLCDFILEQSGISNNQWPALDKEVFFQIRLPRVLMCAVVGAALSMSGTLMQALFRNPIVEPGLIGTSSGAALGAASIFVLGKQMKWVAGTIFEPVLLPAAAFAGGLLATIIVFKVSNTKGRVIVATMILAGVAVNAIAASGTGFLSYIARDPQARSITFWNLGTFSGADWFGLGLVLTATIISFVLALRYAKSLNALLLGEAEALHLGINVESLKWKIILINTLMVGVATAMVGVIGFVGLVVPHLLRMLGGSDNRFLLIGSALLGAVWLVLADLLARVVMAPAEVPIGIITALVGAPVFLMMLINQVRSEKKGGFYA
ncbi:iron ABC transporter permease [Solitalea sp. MAHUQ-68]|uniref:Iron ABC transporter permease n=1 Tax=Solitalea agri TaxID=2953739 RepID=A0A9X2F4C1_9SPHI|nr:iron ABC transporter permease [Solitalea agri]MCO4294066.1 iron ABC transporter permease [Solitalea agri]